MAELLTGAEVAEALNSKTSEMLGILKKKGVHPTLAILRIGDNPDDISYEKSAIKCGESLGVTVNSIVLPAKSSQGAVMQSIMILNSDDDIHGVLLLRPLPEHLDEWAVCTALDPAKDVDGITESSLAGVFTGSGTGYAPCTARACIEILDHYNIDCTGKRAVVVGRSLVVGKPVAVMLMDRHATVTVCHTRTVDVPAVTRDAEIIIATSGQLEGLTKEYFSPGQVIIDVGISWSERKGKLCGDVDFDDVEPMVQAITPVPGGVGTVTTSVLISHVVEAAKYLHHQQELLRYDINR
jgi:methylenetetrahydrofolate dehydrogenase (NADP+)/methenyltetrahydrofolate cyclohydrolase